ncbi:hypothetical protein HQ496_03120 [bacterium]|nr:hypothetical protein [bacterium]
MWLKISDDFGVVCAGLELSDAAFRTHVESLAWAMHRENGGHIHANEVKRFAESHEFEIAVSELVEKGCWSVTEDGYSIKLHMEYQIEPKVINARRQKNAQRQRKSRFKLAGISTETPESPNDNGRDDTRDAGLDGSGLDGSGLDEQTHLGEGLNLVEKEICAECGVDPCCCSEIWADSKADSKLHKILETKW